MARAVHQNGNENEDLNGAVPMAMDVQSDEHWIVDVDASYLKKEKSKENLLMKKLIIF